MHGVAEVALLAAEVLPPAKVMAMTAAEMAVSKKQSFVFMDFCGKCFGEEQPSIRFVAGDILRHGRDTE